MKLAEKNSYAAKQLDINKLILCGLFAAIVAVCSWISLPLPFTQVPINLAILGVLIAGGTLGPKYGPISLGVYILLGAIGLPVFAGFASGLGTLVGPTGGFIVGYILCAGITGLGARPAKDPSARHAAVGPAGARSAGAKSAGSAAKLVFFMALGVLACYSFGTVWYVILMKTSLWVGLVSCVFPFIPFDAIKIAAALLLVRRLQKIR